MDQLNISQDKEILCLSDDQAKHVYKKVETEGIINVDTIKQETEEDTLGRNTDKDEVNPYHEIITNKVQKEDITTTQMEQWSILSNIVNFS